MAARMRGVRRACYSVQLQSVFQEHCQAYHILQTVLHDCYRARFYQQQLQYRGSRNTSRQDDEVATTPMIAPPCAMKIILPTTTATTVATSHDNRNCGANCSFGVYQQSDPPHKTPNNQTSSDDCSDSTTRQQQGSQYRDSIRSELGQPLCRSFRCRAEVETLRPHPVDLQGIGVLTSSATLDQFLGDGKAGSTLFDLEISPKCETAEKERQS